MVCPISRDRLPSLSEWKTLISAKIGVRDFEYLYYLYFPNVLFVSADAQQKKYITEAGILKSRRNSSFAYLPSDRNGDPEEYDKVMRYIKNGRLY